MQTPIYVTVKDNVHTIQIGPRHPDPKNIQAIVQAFGAAIHSWIVEFTTVEDMGSVKDDIIYGFDNPGVEEDLEH